MSSAPSTGPGLDQFLPVTRNPSVSTFLEFAAKMATVLIVAAYAIGYLIVTLNDNAHGFLDTSLVKPRAITAGILFMLLMTVPISATQGTFFPKNSETESDRETFTRGLLGLLDYFTSCAVGGLMMLFVFKDNLASTNSTQGRNLGFLLLCFVVTANGMARMAAEKHYRKRTTLWIVFSVICFLGLGIAVYNIRELALVRCLAWMFVFTSLVNAMLSDMKHGRKFHFRLPVMVALLLGVISMYSVYLFPFMKASWGGGAPVSTVIYLSKDSPIHPSEQAKAELLENSDSGIYVIFDGEEKTTYVPRYLVTAMEFPTSPAGSEKAHSTPSTPNTSSPPAHP